MFGSFTLHATQPQDLEELGGFLRKGFGAAADAPHFSLARMHWKYFEPIGIDLGPRSFIARSGGCIVGHAGMVPRAFHLDSGPDPGAEPVTALHFIDLLASPAHAAAGLMLMKRGFQTTRTQYALGGSSDGQRIALATGYECRLEFSVAQAILRPLHRLGGITGGAIGRGLRAVKDLGNYVAHPARSPGQSLSLRSVKLFDGEVDRLFAQRPLPAVHSTRSSALLNAYLRIPSAEMTGWTLHLGEKLTGFALLNIKAADSVRSGKIVECFLNSRDPDLWHAALLALKTQLRQQQADVATCYAATPWVLDACRLAGFTPGSVLKKFYLRDPNKFIPRDALFHLSMLEGDHGYF